MAPYDVASNIRQAYHVLLHGVVPRGAFVIAARERAAHHVVAQVEIETET